MFAHPNSKRDLMKIGYVQNAPIFGNKTANFEQVKSLVNGQQADLLVLSELFATGYTFTSREEAHFLAESTDGETAKFLKDLSKETGAMIVAGFVELENDKVYNSSLIVKDGEVLDTYRKIHLFNRETLWFDAGNKPLKTYDCNGVSVGIMICFDWLFPEVCRTLTLDGMQVLAHPSNLVMPYCQQAMITRCLENRIFAVTSNRTGRENRGEDDFTFTGASQITANDGNILSSAPKDKPHLSIVEIDPNKALNKMINDYNNLIDCRNTDYYTVG